jgi:CRP/FNR family cyclic AMP-dependent transcriptional regulator
VNTGDHAARNSEPGFWDLLGPAEQDALLSLGHVGLFQPGDAICTEGEMATHVVVITEGWVKIVAVNREHHGTVVALRGPADIVGELAGDGPGYRTASIVAVGDVQALIVTYETFTQFLDGRPSAGKTYRHVMTRRWREAENMLRSRSVSSGAQRLAGLLLDLAVWHGKSAESGTIITIPLSHEELADLIGASRATVTRALRDWRHRGLIVTARRQITIISLPDLRNVAGRQPR